MQDSGSDRRGRDSIRQLHDSPRTKLQGNFRSPATVSFPVTERPGYERWGFSLRMDFPVVKLLDYRGKEKELEASANPFAVVTLAHLAKLGARRLEGKLVAKLRLARLLYRRGYTRQGIQDLLRFLDWILRLPEELEKTIMDATQKLQGKRMPFLSNIERWSIEKVCRRVCRKAGRRDASRVWPRACTRQLPIGLEFRFGRDGLALMPPVRAIQATNRLRSLLRQVKTAKSLAAFRAAVRK